MLLNCGVGEDFWESLGLQPVHPEGNQSWIFIGRTDAEAETPILWPPDAKIWLIRKDPDTRKDWRQEEKEKTEDEMAGWHHWLDGRESGWTPGVGDGQGGLACCSLWGRKESDMTKWLNWTEKSYLLRNCTKSNRGDMDPLRGCFYVPIPRLKLLSARNISQDLTRHFLLTAENCQHRMLFFGNKEPPNSRGLNQQRFLSFSHKCPPVGFTLHHFHSRL